jgi:hypothetical protein
VRGRRKGSPPGRHPAAPRAETVEEAADGDWVVRRLTGSASTKPYRCPGCDQEIRPATPHVVAWPAYTRDSDLDPWDTDSAADQRRHWHTACWGARNRRR